jgi:hypothetical protein
MYYHCRNLKYVKYDKVLPAPYDTIDEYMILAYQWLSKYCAYCPQIWLSRSHSNITGFRSIIKQKSRKMYGKRINNDPNILFGFDIIKGFPVDYDRWCFILNALINKESLKEHFESITGLYKEDNEDPLGDKILGEWISCGSEQEYLKKYLFVETDQVVVPSLNLKVAKKIICRNEKEKKALRSMGFINDRIQIRNEKFWTF